jgi:iron(III) transport system substrate-binding protein
MTRRPLLQTLAALSLATLSMAATAQQQVLNLYSARHYQTDEALYEDFTKSTGIRINRIDGDDAGIYSRLKSEGAASPADVVLMVDAARLWRAEIDGLFQPVRSPVLEARIPANLRGKDDGQGSQWFGFSTRARIVVYDKARIPRAEVDTYEKLASAANKGRLCTRSGSHPYNLSLFGSMLEHLGPQKTETWLKGLVDNMARAPKGGDTDQIKGVASGECGVAITNSYYLARMMRSDKPRTAQRSKRSAWCFRIRVTTARTSILPVGRSPSTRRTALRLCASLNTLPAIPRRTTSPMATTSGRPWPSCVLKTLPCRLLAISRPNRCPFP